MRRRDFITLLGGGAAVWPMVARGQPQKKLPTIGFLHAAYEEGAKEQVQGFNDGLRESGLIIGRDCAIEYRWGRGQYASLPKLASELISQGISALAVGGGPPAIAAAKDATDRIPIVFVSGDDPVKHNFVQSIRRPGGNITGAGFFGVALVAKRLELLRELKPSTVSLGFVGNPSNPGTKQEASDLEAAAKTINGRVSIIFAGSDAEIEAAYSEFARKKIDGVIVGTDPRLFGRASTFATVAMRYRIPTIYNAVEYARAGGLASYGNNITDAYHQAGVYMARVIKGAKPGDLPIIQSSRFDLVINLRTAKALGIDVPLLLQQRADEVIE